MPDVWVVTLNGYVHAVCASVDTARESMREVRETLKGGGTWRPVGADPETAMAWSSTNVTSLAMKPWPVEA